MWRYLLFSLIAFLLLAPNMGMAQVIDPHEVYEERCARCHFPHAGKFARKSLVLQPDRQITGRKVKQPLDAFLNGHSGKPSPAEITALIDMFTIQLNSDGLFEKKCRICHKSAKKMARVRLKVRNGKLLDLLSGRDIHEFLKDHGRLTDAEVEIMNHLLTWQVQTAGR